MATVCYFVRFIGDGFSALWRFGEVGALSFKGLN